MIVKQYINEIWKDVLGYEGLYQVSNYGRVKSLERMVKHYPSGEKVVSEILLKPYNTIKYLQVGLCKDGVRKTYSVHRLVWMAFNGEIPEGYEINHINEDKTDNRLENLSLMSHKDNINWGTRNERTASNRTGKTAPKPILQYDLDGNFIKEWSSFHQIEKELGLHNTGIWACCNGKIKKSYDYFWKYK